MSTLAVMTRLQVNWAEMSGIKRAYLFEPELPIDEGDLPAVYPVQLGKMRDAIPATSAGQYVVTREYIYRVLIASAQAAGTESEDEGAYIDTLAIEFIDIPLDYIIQHPRLNTDSPSNGPLERINQDVKIQDSGPILRLGPGGSQYRAIDYTLIIAERRIPAIQRIS